MEFIGDVNSTDVVAFIRYIFFLNKNPLTYSREVIEKFPHLRVEILEHLLSTFPNIKSSRVFRGALWVIGEYTLEVDTMKKAMSQIRQVIGELPILSSQLVHSLRQSFYI
jgi:coatomer subunit beta